MADKTRAHGRIWLAVAALGMFWTAFAVLDPAARVAAGPGALVAVGGAWLAVRNGGRPSTAAFLAVLALVYAGCRVVPPNLGADSRSYFAILHSAFFDHDLDFANEFRFWGFGDLPADSWLRKGVHPVGPALLWSPFYLLAHAFVLAGRALGRTAWAADGLTGPYVRACALGTAFYAVGGAFVLFAFLRRRFDRATALLATAGTLLASTIPYYLAVQPAMAHGLVFASAALVLFTLGRTEEGPTRRAWIAAGLAFGLLVLLRWQALVALALVAPLAVRDLVRRRARWSDLALAALAALAAFSPQFLAWKAQYGRFLTMPQGAGYVDWSSPHLVDVLLSADRGLVTWTPVALLGLAGLVAGMRRWPLLAGGALVTVALTAWVNGGVRDFAGNDAYGARRFDLAVPLLALGLAVCVETAARLAARRPWLAPAAALAFLALWNLGLMRAHARGAFPEAAPFERVAGVEARTVRDAVESALGRLGPRSRALAYKAFVGEYLYENVNLGGTIDVGGEEGRWLGEGWSGSKWREGSPRFRWALAPQACLRLPFEQPVDLRATITARAPRRLEGQTFAVVVNGRVTGEAALGPEWTDTPFTIPRTALVPGENAVCFRFARSGGEEGQPVAAQVARVQLP